MLTIIRSFSKYHHLILQGVVIFFASGRLEIL